MTRVAIDLFFHVIASILFSAWIFIETKNPWYVAIFILGGVFIDLDHFFDYFLSYKNKFDLKELFRCEYLKFGKVYLPLHSWEMDLALFIISISIKSHGLFLFALSIAVHLLIDNLQRRNVFFYFLAYRFYKQFEVATLLPEHKDKLN
jgi:hypothetical protein